MGVDTGPDPMIEVSEDFGFNQDVPIDLTAPARSNFPTDFEQNLPALAQSAIGQNDVAATPLQMAMVAAAVANGGEVMAPHVLRDVRDPDGNVVDTYDPEVWTTAMDEPTADLMRRGDARRRRQRHGDAPRRARLRRRRQDRHRAARHRARRGRTPGSSASPDPRARRPPSPIAVIVEGQPGASEQTGGRVAAPIAQAVLAAYLAGVTCPRSLTRRHLV